MFRSSAAAAAQMRSVYNPAGNKLFAKHFINTKYFNPIFFKLLAYSGMPGSGGHYGVMGRSQDHRGSMFGSSLNLNGKYPVPSYPWVLFW